MVFLYPSMKQIEHNYTFSWWQKNFVTHEAKHNSMLQFCDDQSSFVEYKGP